MSYTIALAQCTSLPDISQNLVTAEKFIAEAQKEGHLSLFSLNTLCIPAQEIPHLIQRMPSRLTVRLFSV